MDNPRVLPEKATEMLEWSWSQFEPHYVEPVSYTHLTLPTNREV